MAESLAKTNYRGFQKGNPGRPKGAVAKGTREIKAAARGILEDPGYVKLLVERIRTGQAPAIETLLYHYAYGKPTERTTTSGELVVRWQRPDDTEPR
jgi:hypothetical protein